MVAGLRVDLNCDVGESYGAFKIGVDQQLFRHVTSANIACGWHAGDPLTMRETVRLASSMNVAIGAHPGFPDLLGFGRRNMSVSEEEARSYVTYQVGALDAFVRAAGTRMQHVKLHGAFYNMAAEDERLARAVAQAVREYDPDLLLVGLAGSRMLEIAREYGLRVVHEAFADRAYLASGRLAPRSAPGAVIHEPKIAAARAVRIVSKGTIETIDGQEIAVHANSICIHGDNPEACAVAAAIRDAFQAAGIEVTPMRLALK